MRQPINSFSSIQLTLTRVNLVIIFPDSQSLLSLPHRWSGTRPWTGSTGQSGSKHSVPTPSCTSGADLAANSRNEITHTHTYCVWSCPALSLSLQTFLTMGASERATLLPRPCPPLNPPTSPSQFTHCSIFWLTIMSGRGDICFGECLEKL